MSNNHQTKIIDIVLLVLEDMFEKSTNDSERKLVSKRIEFFTNKWAELKTQINGSLSVGELEECHLAIQWCIEIYQYELTLSDDVFLRSYLNALKEVQKALPVYA